MKQNRWTLRQRLLVLCALVATLLGALAAGAATAAAINREQVNAVIDTYTPLRADSERLLAVLVDQETGVRGFALSGDVDDLEPYTDGVAEEQRLLAAMDRLLVNEASARAQMDGIRTDAARWRSDFAERVIAAVRSDGPAAGQALISDAARQQFDRLREAVSRFQNTILDLRQQAGERARSTSNTLVELIIIAGAVILLAGFGLALLLERLVARPVTALAAQVRTVAGGQYDAEISGDGPPELASLARDVDGMRRQIVRDLREVRRARESIEAANAKLEAQAEELTRSNRDLEQFAYVASHDLQEPLRKVASFCQLLQRRYAGQLDERADQYIAFAVNGAQRMQRLINDLLAFSRIGRISAGFSDLDLNRVVAETVASLDTLTSRGEAQVTWDDLPVVRGEEALLATLLSNLISNSVKFRRPDAPPKVHISAERDGDEWVIACTDNGIGVEPQFADKVFVIFQRLHPKDAYPGTGIGLAIAQKIVEYHGGRIWIDPDHVDGTAIKFTLPVAASEETSA